jgi:sugar lactone lactonase YvrE
MKKSLLLVCLLTLFTYPQELKKVADGIDFPEGPAWDGKENLYVSAIDGGYILKISKDSASVFIDSGSTI